MGKILSKLHQYLYLKSGYLFIQDATSSTWLSRLKLVFVGRIRDLVETALKTLKKVRSFSNLIRLLFYKLPIVKANLEKRKREIEALRLQEIIFRETEALEGALGNYEPDIIEMNARMLVVAIRRYKLSVGAK